MNELRKAAEMALEALECMKQYGNVFLYRSHEQNPYDQVCDALTKLRQALAQAEKQPIDLNALGIPHGTLFQPAQPEQEPVADNLIRTYVSAAMANNENLMAEATKEMINYVCSFIENTAAPKREWVGLTDEQIYEHEWWDEETAFAVNKELKEKNCG